jgi:tRNA-splicing ligase RtcB
MKTYPSIEAAKAALIHQGNAMHILPIDGRKPVMFVANERILADFDDKVYEQAVNTAETPGVENVVVNPDGHAGYGCPVGSVVTSRTHIYPGPVGPDISCSMSFLQTDLDDSAIVDKRVRRALIDAICARIPTGAGSRQAPKARTFSHDLLWQIPIHGASSAAILDDMGIPISWASYVEDFCHGDSSILSLRLSDVTKLNPRLEEKLIQIGSYGGGNHFGECQTISIAEDMKITADCFGLKAGKVGFMSHCGSRGFGYQLAAMHFRGLEAFFNQWGLPFPGGEKELVYAPLGTQEAESYILDMYLGANFAVVNHLLINAYVLEAFQEVFPGVKGDLVYHISHNIGRQEAINGNLNWVFRKGATRAFPAGHHALKGTRYQDTGHPILLPGNPEAGSFIMVASPEAEKTCFSINHGAGRCMGRREAKRTLSQEVVDNEMLQNDILSNCRRYPVDEAPAAYKNFDDVTQSIVEAKLAQVVARLKARFVIKDSDQSAEGSA